jgi:hypothetical protein
MKKFLDKSSNVLSEPGKIQVQMVEGDAVFVEAIDFLNSLPYLKPLEWDDNLALSAMEHVLDIGPKGLLSYQSSDGTEPEERISRYGNYIDALGENIDFGPNDAMGVLISLTLDDGEPDRPHRENLFKTDYQKIGIACGPHKTEYQMCVMDFAYDFVGFSEDNEELSLLHSNNTNDMNNFNLNNVSVNKNKNDLQNLQQKNEIPKNSSNNNNNNNSTLNKNNTNYVPSSQTYTGNNNSNSNLNLNRNNNDMDLFIDNTTTANFSNKKNSNNNINPYENTFGNPNKDSKFAQININSNSNTNEKISSQGNNQSPLVRLSLDEKEFKSFKQNSGEHQNIRDRDKNYNNEGNANINNETDEMAKNVKLINLEKKIVSKLVEVTTKIVYTYEDGSTKEVIEKENHTFRENF